MTAIWNAAAGTPTATHRVPVDVSSSGIPTRYTVQQLADLQTLVGISVNAIGSIGTNTSIDLALGGFVSATITGNLTFTFTNTPSGGCSFVLVLTNGGAHTITWPGSVTWSGATAPTLTASGTDILHFVTGNGGTNWYGWVENDEVDPAASTTVAGRVELAIASEVDTGTDATRAMTPDSYRDSTPYYTSRSANFTLAQTDMNTEQQFDSASNYVCTIDTNANVAIATQSVFMFSRTNTGTATIDAVAGVTINGVDGASHTIDSYGVCFLRKVGTNAYLLAGQFT